MFAATLANFFCNVFLPCANGRMLCFYKFVIYGCLSVANIVGVKSTITHFLQASLHVNLKIESIRHVEKK